MYQEEGMNFKFSSTVTKIPTSSKSSELIEKATLHEIKVSI